MATPPIIVKISTATMYLLEVSSNKLTQLVVRQNRCLLPKAIEGGREKWGGSSDTTDTITARQLCSSRNKWYTRIRHISDRTLSSYKITTTRRESRRRTLKLKRTKNCWLISKWALEGNLRAVYRTKILSFKIKTKCLDSPTTNLFNNRSGWLLKPTTGIPRALLVPNTLSNPNCFIPSPTLLCSTSAQIPASSPTLPQVKLT